MNNEGKFINIEFQSSPAKKLIKSVRYVVPQDEIIKYFSSVQSKNDVIDGYLDFSAACFDTRAVFAAFPNGIQLLKGEGENFKDKPHIGLYRFDGNCVVRRSIVNKSSYAGQIPVDADEKRLFQKYFFKHADEIFIYPSGIRTDTTEIVFYSDSLVADRDSAIATYEYIIEKASLALKFLWIKRELTTL